MVARTSVQAAVPVASCLEAPILVDRAVLSRAALVQLPGSVGTV
jgi:hypothetical protein